MFYFKCHQFKDAKKKDSKANLPRECAALLFSINIGVQDATERHPQ